MRRLTVIMAFLALGCLSVSAQVDKRDVRAGNRKYRKENFKEAEIDFRKALVKDSTSLKASYNLASSLYEQGDYQSAMKSISTLDGKDNGADYWFNKGNAALQLKDYKTAVDAFRNALVQTPEDMEAKESYTYAKMMLQNQQNQDNQQNQQDNKDQDRNQDQQNQDDRNDNNQNPDQDKKDGDGGNQPQPQQISPQQAQQMLRAIQAKERDTQDKVNKEKAAAMQSRQKEKNW